MLCLEWTLHDPPSLFHEIPKECFREDDWSSSGCPVYVTWVDMMGPAAGFFFRLWKGSFWAVFWAGFLLLIPCYLYKRIESPHWKHNLFVFSFDLFRKKMKGDHKPSTQRFKRCSLYVPTRLCEGYKISQAYIMEVLAWRIIQMITFTQIQQLL